MVEVRAAGVIVMLGVRGVGLVVAAVVLCSCGPAGSDAVWPAAAPPYGAETVAWPSTGPDITALLEALPGEVDGLVGQGVESGDIGYGRQYGQDMFVVVAGPGPDDWNDSAAESLQAELYWAGGRAGCLDWASSPALMPQDVDAGQIEAAIAGGTEFVWFQCLAVRNIDQGGTLPPEQQGWVFAFVSGEEMYYVAAKTTDGLRELAQALVSTARRTPWE